MANADWSARFLKQVEIFYAFGSRYQASSTTPNVDRPGGVAARAAQAALVLENVKKAASGLLSLRTELVGILGAPDIPVATSASILSAFDNIPLGVMDPRPKNTAAMYRKQLLDWYNTKIKSLL